MFELIDKNPKNYPRLLSSKKYADIYASVLLFLNYKTPLLQNPEYKLVTKIYWVLNDLKDFPCCLNCGKKVGIGKNVGLNGYFNYCSKLCARKSKYTIEKTKNTNLERYGGTGYASPKLNKKCRQTFKNKTGVEYSAQNKESIFKRNQTIQQKYPKVIDNRTPQEKRRDTCLAKYGVEHYSKTKEFKEKVKTTLKNKYDVEYMMHLDAFKEKSKQTCLKKYGVEYSFQSKNNIDKSVKTKKDRFKDGEIFEKIRNTHIEKYGGQGFASKQVSRKIKQTMFNLYGVEYSAQNIDIFKKQRKRNIQYNGIFFDSSWELEVYLFCEKHGIKFEYQPNIKFAYSYENTVFFYFPDFKINNCFYEVKGPHFFRITNGIKEMFCPFRNKNMTDDEYNFLCQKY